MLVMNFFTRESFYVTPDMEYRMGSLRLIMYCAQFCYYIVILSYTTCRHFTRSNNRVYSNVFLFSLIPLTFGIGQYLFYDVAMYSIGFNLSAFIIYAFNLTDMREAHLEKLADERNRAARIDALTGLLNRRAFEEDFPDHTVIPAEDDFLCISLDLDELKMINDDFGHEAGDEMIKGAADCMKKVFGESPKIYRTGGDEFVAVVFADKDRAWKLKDDFGRKTSSWRGELVKKLHVSSGWASKSEFPGKKLGELFKAADERMYRSKADFYATKGIDRRAQTEAFTALCGLYKKIIKVNLTSDTHRIITMNQDEGSTGRKIPEKISVWLHDFAFSGNVHPEDRENYLAKTDLTYLREYFLQGNTSISIPYRRMDKDGYVSTIMEFAPAKDYSPESQSLFLYVKTVR